MKRTTSIFILLCAAIFASAQTQSLGVQLGFSEPILRDNSITHNKKLSNATTTNGVKVGLVYDATLVKGFGLNLSLNYLASFYNGKWVKDPVFTAKQTKTNYTVHTIELPIEWQYKFRIATDTWLIAHTGPVLQYNIAFNQRVSHRDPIKGEWTDKSSHYDTNLDGDDKPDFSHFNIQWGIGAGFQYKNYFIRGGYNFGIYNHFRDSYNEVGGYSNRGRFDEWNIRIGIYFLNF
ncbi:MAG: outer membrane beta-barrel protein [Paludibacteraceae bacterium]|nr:outer membrane beta-barrel protein [Paludibacteraceae bacterium]